MWKQVQSEETEKNGEVIHTMLVVIEKHMQDANWVYYPFKNTVMFYMEQCPFEQQQTVLAQVHELYNRKTNKKKKRERSTIKISTKINK